MNNAYDFVCRVLFTGSLLSITFFLTGQSLVAIAVYVIFGLISLMVYRLNDEANFKSFMHIEQLYSDDFLNKKGTLSWDPTVISSYRMFRKAVYR